MPETPPPPATRRERERERHRLEILDAAEEVFSTKGITGATIEDIARRADFAVGTIYNFFSGKEDLSRQVLIRLFKTRIMDIEQQVLPLQHDPEAALRALTNLWVSHHIRHGAFLKVAFLFRMGETNGGEGPSADPDIREHLDQYDQTGRRFFAAGVEAGLFQPLPPHHLLLIFEGICRSFLFAWRHNADTRPEEELARELYAAVFAALTGKTLNAPTA